MRQNYNMAKTSSMTKHIILASILLLLSAMKVAAAECPTNMTGYRGSSSTVLSCTCTGLPPAGTVWGTKVYTDDSVVCQAAVHAGKRAWGETKTLDVHVLPGRSFYYYSWAYGVTGWNWKSKWPGSFSFDEENRTADHTNYLKQINNANSVTFFAGGDPQFGFTPSDLTWQDATSNADATMNYVSMLASNCFNANDGCVPAFTIAGDLLMDNSATQQYLGGAEDNYLQVLSSINENSAIKTVVLDGLGNHDTDKNPYGFFDLGNTQIKPTGYFSRSTTWDVLHSSQKNVCWDDGNAVNNSGVSSSSAYYCATENLQYYTVGIKRNTSGSVTINSADAYIVQLHSGGTNTNDSNALAYLDELIASYGQPGGLNKNIPIFLVAHWLKNDTALQNKTKQLNVAGIILGHQHENITGKYLTGWGSVPNHHIAGNWRAPILNASALLYNVFLSLTVEGNKVTVSAFDRTKDNNSIKSHTYNYRP